MASSRARHQRAGQARHPSSPGTSFTALVIPQPGAELQVGRRGHGDLDPGWVRVTVLASGLCHADLGTATARRSAYGFPITPGHEIAGVIAEVGAGVSHRQVGERVVVGWFGGSCGQCPSCRAGAVVHCPERKITGVS
ncbi:MAG: alcohol dehydrogenase catalytic domain-containing protein, partial [Nocardioides sp.]